MKKHFIFSLFIFIFVKADAQQAFKEHPEKGMLPFNAPCKSCTEEIEKRTGNTREFFALNDDGIVAPVYTELKSTTFPFPVKWNKMEKKFVRVSDSSSVNLQEWGIYNERIVWNF